MHVIQRIVSLSLLCETYTAHVNQLRAQNSGFYASSLVSNSSNVFHRADMKYYIIYWLSGEIYFFIILDVVTITRKTDMTNYACKFTLEDKT